MIGVKGLKGLVEVKLLRRIRIHVDDELLHRCARVFEHGDQLVHHAGLSNLLAAKIQHICQLRPTGLGVERGQIGSALCDGRLVTHATIPKFRIAVLLVKPSELLREALYVVAFHLRDPIQGVDEAQ